MIVRLNITLDQNNYNERTMIDNWSNEFFFILLFKAKLYIALMGYILQFLYLSVEAKADAQTSGNSYKQPVSNICIWTMV